MMLKAAAILDGEKEIFGRMMTTEMARRFGLRSMKLRNARGSAATMRKR